MPLYPIIDYDAVVSACQPRAMIRALRADLRSSTVVPERQDISFGNGRLLTMPAWQTKGYLAVKVVTVVPENPARGQPTVQGAILLFSVADGSIIASLDGRAITQLRTAAVAALATDMLCSPDARTLLIVGTGALASPILDAATTVRNFEQVVVWGRDPDKALAVARAAPSGTYAEADLARAATSADVIICATSATAPLIQRQHLKENVALIAMGGFRPDMIEIHPACFRDAHVVVDSVHALDEAGDLLRALVQGTLRAEDVCTLASLEAGHRTRRIGRNIFKSVGSATFDLTAAALVFEAVGGARLGATH